MIKIIFNILLILFVCNHVFGQILESKTEQNAELTRDKPRKEYDPPKFGHQPFLVLKVAPQYLFSQDNVFMFGGEIAPPFGKISLAADYGVGRGSWNFRKDVRNFFNDQKTKIIKGELKAYFSDLYYFYSLDMKPLGRYYSLEYTQRDISVTRLVGVSNQGSFFELNEIPIQQAEWMLHAKFGKNFLVSRWFMIDTHIGLGVRHYKVTTTAETIDTESVTRYFINKNKRDWLPNENGLLPSFVAGFRLCVPL